MSEKVTAMIEEIKGLTVLELSELVHALEEEFGVSAAAMAAPVAGAAAPAAEEKTDFDVVLAGFDAAAKIKVIKVVREITGQGLAEAKATVEGAPKTLKEGASKEDAFHSEGSCQQGRGRGSEEADRRGRRQGRAEVSKTFCNIKSSVSMDTELFCSLKRVFRGKKLTFAEKISEGGTWPRRHCGPTALPPESVPERSRAWHR